MKNTKNITRFGQILASKGYSKNTIAVYMACIKNLSVYYKLDTSRITNEMVQDFLVNRVISQCFSHADQNQHINSIKLYYMLIYNKQLKPKYVKRPRVKHRLPVVLNTNEVEKLLQKTYNLKHKTILYTIYSLGLRISESVNLRLSDIDSKTMRVFIRNSKGGKDRVITLQQSLLDLLRIYYRSYKPKIYLFNGQNSLQYSTTSITNIFQAAVKKAGISKRVTVHTLRHSYATHLLEENLPLPVIQKMLGHKSSKTTEIYTHITDKSMNNVKLPFIKIA